MSITKQNQQEQQLNNKKSEKVSDCCEGTFKR